MKRTHLPLNGLRVLDAAARHLSFTRAADELAVTPAAVGQQIRALEDTLGVVLFRRTAKGLELTPEGEAGLDALRAGFLQFEEAVRAMQAGQSSKTLTIAAPRDFTAKWLAPRLADFGRTDPELRFVLLSSDEGLDFTQANLDLAISYSDGAGEHEGVQLAEGAIVTVGLADGAPIGWPGCPVEDKGAGLMVADAGLAIDAAAAGFGTAHVPALLAERDIGEGRVRAHGEPKPTPKSYWLVAPTPQWRQKKVKALVATLTAVKLPLRNSAERTKMATFLLVPGAFHPAWIWHRIVTQLEAKGHRAIALDLPGTGENMSAADSEITLALWADYVADQVRKAGGNVVLAGHSRGGHVIGEAAERVPDALAGLIYVTAVISPPGMAMLEAIGREPDEGFAVTDDGRVDLLPEDVATAMFYHRCPADDVEGALAHLYREPWTPAGTPSGVSWERWGRVPRAFIECTDDQALDMACQQRMQARAPCDPVITLDADHSPFFCAPEALADAMITCAGQFAAARAAA